MMKRTLILMVFAISVLGASAQSVEALFRQYRHEKNVEYMRIPRFVMSMARMLTKADKKEGKTLRAISSIRCLDVEGCTPAVKESFRKTIQTFRPAGYRPIVFSKEADETCYIYIKEKKDCIRELLILTADAQEGAVVQIKGRIKPGDVDKIVKQNTKKNKQKKT